ncbi:unnamed protein product [Protopolystoma xenopodis]|uniref:Uncharacterized protein n=1 Tax=Protopolystoma xenopodis TaxID=117903 RepID=A0A3S5AET5_9PLAT|nr:unnamed protein product [Protopolystoma xenopodis]
MAEDNMIIETPEGELLYIRQDIQSSPSAESLPCPALLNIETTSGQFDRQAERCQRLSGTEERGGLGECSVDTTGLLDPPSSGLAIFNSRGDRIDDPGLFAQIIAAAAYSFPDSESDAVAGVDPAQSANHEEIRLSLSKGADYSGADERQGSLRLNTRLNHSRSSQTLRV